MHKLLGSSFHFHQQDTMPHERPNGIPDGIASLLLFGGSFDPPHRAHIELPLFARAQLGLDWLAYMPAAQAPLKAPLIASCADRLAMLQLALAGNTHVGVTDFELQRKGVSYTVETLAALQKALGTDVTIRLCIGTDQALHFHLWKDARRVLNLAEPVVLRRPPVTDPESLFSQMAPHWSTAELDAWRARTIETPALTISSTKVRERLLHQGPTDPWLAEALHPAVLAYIREHGLYQKGSPASCSG